MQPDRIAKEWLHTAQQDLASAQFLMNMIPVHSRYPFFREIDPTETIDLVKKTESAFIQIKDILVQETDSRI